MDVAVALLTRDLRMRDNPVLAAAAADADRIVPLFVFDEHMLSTHHRSPNRLGFLVESLADLDASLQERGGGLVVRHGDWQTEVANVVIETGARVVHIARDVSGFAQGRLTRLVRECPCPVVTHDSVTVAPLHALKPYSVFTPYWRRWLDTSWRPVAKPVKSLRLPDGIDRGSLPAVPPGRAPAVMPGGETAGLARLKAWSTRRLADYERLHDAVGDDATSRVSPYLHFGCISPLEVASRLRDRAGGDAFVRQLCWRDFFHQFLANRPETAYRDVRDNAAPRWVDDPDALDAWKRGETGFPLVDAGMRQLLREGWMHNRARMVTASFLTKDLLIDWRVGAAHFMEHLVDGDVAVNQLNWQWVAGTGTDTNPHRVYNPTVQAKKFDPDGTYARRYVAELNDPDDSYPPPLVDHAEAIARWREARS